MFPRLKTFFHIFVLAGLALSPLYGVLSEEPNFFLAHSSEPIDFVVLIVVISFVFPLVIGAGATFVLFLFGRYQKYIIKIFITFLVALVLLPFVKKVTGESVLIPVFVVGYLGIAFSYVYCKNSAPKLFLSYISPALLIFPLLFIFTYQIFVLVVPEDIRKRYPVVSIPSDAPVIFVVLDEFSLSSILNADLMIEKRAFPNFARLADKSHWFRNASANYDFTGHALKGMLTGLDQYDKRVGTYRNFPNNLFTLLGHDYQVEADESALRLCPPHICLAEKESKSTDEIEMLWKDIAAVYLHLILPQPRSFGVPEISQSYMNFWEQNREVGSDSERQNAFVRKEFTIPMQEKDFGKRIMADREDLFNHFLDKLNSGGKKQFYFLHILLPHMPYRFLPSGKKYDPTGKFDFIGLNRENPERETWGKENWLNKIQIQKYLNQVGYTDYLLGKLLDRLEEKNILNPAMVIVTADHGVSINAGGFRRRVEGDYLPDIASVPLFIKLPDQNKGRVSDLPATLLDIFPTLADVLRIKVPWQIKGHSLLNFPPGKRERIIHDYELETYRVPEDLKPYLLDKVKTKRKLFGNFSGWTNFRLQDENSKAFMDEPVSEFTVQVMENVQVELDLGSRVEATQNYLPAMVQGQVTGIEKKDEWISLIAVNGVFQASSPIIKMDDQEKILAFLPEKAFKEGSNDLGVYLIRKPFEQGAKIFKPHLVK